MANQIARIFSGHVKCHLIWPNDFYFYLRRRRGENALCIVVWNSRSPGHPLKPPPWKKNLQDPYVGVVIHVVLLCKFTPGGTAAWLDTWGSYVRVSILFIDLQFSVDTALVINVGGHTSSVVTKLRLADAQSVRRQRYKRHFHINTLND